jgi:hypothetical protein
MHHKNITIVNELSEVTLQVVASPMIIILMTPKVPFMLLDNIYSTGVTHNGGHLQLSYFYSTSHIFIHNEFFWSFTKATTQTDMG